MFPLLDSAEMISILSIFVLVASTVQSTNLVLAKDLQFKRSVEEKKKANPKTKMLSNKASCSF